MAFLITKDNRPVFVTAEQAALLWLVKTGERKGTIKTRKKADSIRKWYLTYDNAPKSWRLLHPRRSEFAIQPRLPYRN